MSEKFQRGSIVINKGAEEFDNKIVVLVTGDRSKRDDHFSGVCLSTNNHRITPIGDFSDTWHLSKFEKLFDSFEEWLTANRQAQRGALWVKASERLPGYETPVKWRDGKDHSHVTDGKIPLIHMAKPFLTGWEWYDEGATAAGREEDAVAFAEWLNDNYISVEMKDEVKVYVQYGPQEYHKKKEYKIKELYQEFKQQKEK